MELDRNINQNGKGKYALIKMREIPGNPTTPEELAAAILENPQSVDWGTCGSDGEFFVMRLKDKYTERGLTAYADAAIRDGNTEWGFQVHKMASRSLLHPSRKRPD